jgi:itaconate CoA-transferase
MHWVVTEHGRIDLHGMDLAHRARGLISLAAPRFRDELTAAALNRGLFRDG